MLYRERVCPICGNNKVDKGVSSKIAAESLAWDDVSQLWRGLFKEKSFFTYERCVDCGTLYAPMYFSDAQLGELYASMEANMDEVSAAVLKKTQRGYYDAIQNYTKVKGGYLELGPDVGYFTEHCLKSGTYENCWLIEPNRDVWAALESVTSGNSNLHIYPNHSDVAEIPDGSLTFAAAIHVMDHLTDPVSVLRNIREKMADEGVIMCVTHDEHSLLARLLGSRWPAYCLQHPQLYNQYSISRLFEKAGFEVLKVKKSVNYFPLGFLLKQGLWASMRIKPAFLDKLDFINVGLRLGNILTLARPLAKN